jgi:hypothetical protein
VAALASGCGHVSARHFGNGRYFALVVKTKRDSLRFSIVALYLLLFYFVMHYVFKA